MKKAKESFINYIKTRGVFFFAMFLVINVISFLPFENILSDIFSHFRLQYLILGFIFLILFIYLSNFNKKFMAPVLISSALLILNFTQIVPYIGKTDFENTDLKIKIGLYNLLSKNNNYEKLTHQVEECTFDILIFQEINAAWDNEIKVIKEKYPYSIKEPRDDNFGIAIYSKIPLINPEIEYWGDYYVPVIKTEINLKEKTINIYAVHTLPPISTSYFETRNEMLSKISKIKNPVIIAGDLNTTIYSNSYKNTVGKSELLNAQIKAKNLNGSYNAFLPSIFRIPIDNILYSKDLKLNSLKFEKPFGSDHMPLYIEIGI